MNSMWENVENDITCQVCFEKFNDADRKPCNLPCGHSFCKSCWQSILKNNMASCPSDRKPFSSDVLNQINYPLMSLVKNLDNIISNQSTSTAASEEIEAHWVDSIEDRYFINKSGSNKWIEFQKGKVYCEFDFVRFEDEAQTAVIYDPGRNMYVKITNEALMWSHDLNVINYITGHGSWKIKPKENKQNEVNAEWVDSEMDRKFTNKNGSKRWIEYQNGKVWAEFEFVRFEDEAQTAVIYDPGRNMYVKITNEALMWSQNENSITNVIANGYWKTFPTKKKT